MEKILVTPRSFGKSDPAPIQLLTDAGYEVVVNPYGRIMTKREMIREIADVVGVVNGVDPMDADVLAAGKKLRAVSKYGVGTDNIDLEAAAALGLQVKTAAGANANAVADYAFALMLACARRLVEIDGCCKRQDWTKRNALDLYGKRLGILGLGAIGKGVARRARGFDMEVLAYDIFWNEEYAAQNGIAQAAPEEIYKTCDFISLHLPLTPQTRHMIGDAEFKLMKPTAVLVNTARGGVVDEASLVRALKGGEIYAAGFDAFEQEPPVNHPELFHLDRLVMGAHSAASTDGATLAMGMTSAKNLLEMLKQRP